MAINVGFVFDRQKGSHAVYYRERDKARIVVPRPRGFHGLTPRMEIVPYGAPTASRRWGMTKPFSDTLLGLSIS